MSPVTRLAVVGAGRMGSVHIGACRAAAGVELAAVVEARAEVRDAVCGDHGVPGYGRADELVTAGGFDAVVIAAPSDQHVDLVRLFAEAGIPTLCEKPCGLRVDEVETAVAAARASGTLLQVGYWRRYVPELIALRDQIRTGGLGAISMVSCYQWDHDLPSAEFRAHSGGVAIDMGVHEFDQLRWLTGREIAGVTAIGSAPGVDPPSAVITVSLNDAGLGLVSLGRPYPGPDSCWVDVIGEGRHLSVPFMTGASAGKVFRDGVAVQLEAFAGAVVSGKARGATGADAVAALTVAEAVTGQLARAG